MFYEYTSNVEKMIEKKFYRNQNFIHPITCILSSEKANIVIGGSETGGMIIYDMENQKTTYLIIQNIFELDSKILFMHFYEIEDLRNSKSKTQNKLIIGNSKGKLIKIRFSQKILAQGGKKIKKNLFPMSFPDMLGLQIFDEQNELQTKIYVITTQMKVILFFEKFKKDPDFELKRPDSIEKEFVPYSFLSTGSL